jgi:outer membrane protein
MTLETASLRRTLPLVLAAVLAWTQPAHADAPAARLAAIDMGQLMERSEPGAKLLKPLTEFVKAKRAEDLKMQEALKDLRARAADLAKKGSKEQELGNLQREFDDKLADLRSYEDEANQEVDKKRFEVLAQFNHIAMPVIQSMGKELGYTMIFRKEEGGLLYLDDSADITDLVIQRLNAQAATQK